ncbi:hypothetical protein [Streptomyces sp. NPDC000983]|uniref:hypothetical protein n=1 Tax=Streptomyces sp. NPDC000983 TaxID=3154373 RepID=UPI00331A9A57
MSYGWDDAGDDAFGALIKIAIQEGYGAAKKWLKNNPEAVDVGKAAFLAQLNPVLGGMAALELWQYGKKRA